MKTKCVFKHFASKNLGITRQEEVNLTKSDKHVNLNSWWKFLRSVIRFSWIFEAWL